MDGAACKASEKAGGTKERWQSLQVLRAIAATLVVWTHAEAYVAPFYPTKPTIGRAVSATGAFGVDIFFVVSGAVMILTTRNIVGKPGNGVGFFKRRFARIYPVYWLYLTLLTSMMLLLSGNHLGSEYVLKSYALFPVLSGEKLRPLLGVGWTLMYEMYFYLVLALMLRLPRAYVLPVTAAVLCGGAGLARLALAPNGALGVFFSDLIVVEFVLGMALGTAITSLRSLPRASGPALLLLGWGWWLAMQAPPLIERWFLWGPPAFFIVAGAMLTEQSGLWKVNGGWPVAVGDSSYSLYLLHPVLFYFANGVMKRVPGLTALPGELLVVVAIIGCVLLSLPAYRLIELPLTRFAQNLLGTRAATVSGPSRAPLTPEQQSANNA